MLYIEEAEIDERVIYTTLLIDLLKTHSYYKCKLLIFKWQIVPSDYQ